MIEIIRWVREIENIAHDVYVRSADFFQHDEELATFLYHIAEDEAWHYHVMSSAMDYCTNLPASQPGIVPAITVDKEIYDTVKGAFSRISDKLSSDTLTKEFLFQQILLTEYSEWNDLFQYVVNSLKKVKREFMYAATRIQGHKRFIELFLENVPHLHQTDTKKLKTLPSIWDEKILIIEDDESLSQLVQAILEKEGSIDTACDGAEGLQKIRENYYKLIISDIDMPVMNGLECLTRATELYPNIHERFLFITGNTPPETMSFLQQHRIPFLKKPARINAIRKHSLDILLKANTKIVL